MTSLASTIIPNSEQTNADDLIAGPRTIRITKVSGGSKEQPINIHYENDDGKPYRPSKGMRRLMVALWGDDGHQYVGRSLTIYQDPEVKFGGLKVGGIRISHMSHIPADTSLMITVTRGKKQEHTVKKLSEVAPAPDKATLVQQGEAEASKGEAALKAWWSGPARPHQKLLADQLDRLKEMSVEKDKPAPITGSTGTEAHAAGMNAGVDATCPHDEGTQEAADWMLGWQEANA